MKNLHSILSALLAFALLLSLCACGKKTETKAGTTPSNSTSATATGILPVSLSWTAGGPDNGEVKSTTTYSLDPGTKTLTVTDDHSGVLEPGEILLGLAGDSTLPEHPLLLTQMAYTSPQYRSSVFQSCLYLLFAENDLIRSGAITTLQLNQTNADPEEEHQDTYTFQAKGGKLLSYTHKSTSDTSTDYAPNSTATSEGTVTYQYDGDRLLSASAKGDSGCYLQKNTFSYHADGTLKSISVFAGNEMGDWEDIVTPTWEHGKITTVTIQTGYSDYQPVTIEYSGDQVKTITCYGDCTNVFTYENNLLTGYTFTQPGSYTMKFQLNYA
ncbi:MAG: hypothetical protein IJ133_02510 [Clostridia bacterium]|nr:hypothetical protein [Clostridia bacterium]